MREQVCDCPTTPGITSPVSFFREMTHTRRGPMSSTDQELMDRLCAGDTACLGDLYDRHGAAVVRHCRRMIGDTEAARDLTQEVFLRVFRYRDSFEGRSRFTTWLYRITRNVCLDYMAREKRRMRFGASEPAAGHQNDPSAPGDAAAGIERRQMTEQLEAALGRLSPAHREIILLMKFQDMTYEEVSRVLDCTVNAARVRFHRAIAQLRDEYMKSRRTGE